MSQNLLIGLSKNCLKLRSKCSKHLLCQYFKSVTHTRSSRCWWYWCEIVNVWFYRMVQKKMAQSLWHH